MSPKLRGVLQRMLDEDLLRCGVGAEVVMRPSATEFGVDLGQSRR